GAPLVVPEYTKSCDKMSGGEHCETCGGMARYSAHSMLASLNIRDTPLSYKPPRGPAIDFAVTYNQRETRQPSTYSYSNLGPKWTFNWLTYVIDDPNWTPGNVALYDSAGGTESYPYNSATHTFSQDAQSHAILIRNSDGSYEKHFPDGSKQV